MSLVDDPTVDGLHRVASWLRWLSLIPTLPIVAAQARRARRVIPRLPDARGPVEGTCHATIVGGPALNLLVLGESTVSGVGASTHERGLAGGIARALVVATGRDVRWLALGKNGVDGIHPSEVGYAESGRQLAAHSATSL